MLRPGYPRFSALLYSLGVFLPIVDLHQEAYWLPTARRYWWYLWFHIIAGWTLTTVLVAALSGLIKRD